MSFNGWLQNLVSLLAPGRGQRPHQRRGSFRAARHRLNFDALEDRCLLAFIAPVDYAVGPNPQAVVTADFNNDGLLDLATANTGGNTVSLRLGDGQGGFRAANQFVTDAEPRAMAVGDFNNDGNLDLVTATSSDNTAGPDPNTISVLMGNGNGTFQPPDRIVTTSGWEFPSVAVADFNDDGNLDLVHTTVEDFQFEPSEVLVMLGDGAGGFAYSGGHFPSTVPVGLAVADLNDDSWPDVVTANQYSDNVSVMLGNGDGTLSYSYTGSSEFAAGRSLRAVAVGDFSGDGVPDLVTVGESVDFLLGLGDGTFASPLHYSTGGVGQTSLATADFNGDGKLDVVTANPGAGTVSVLLGSGDGTLQAPVSQTGGSSPSALAVGTFNSDRYPDVAAADAGSNAVSVLLNDHDWTPSTPLPPSISIGDVSVTEGNAGTQATTFTVTLSTAYDQPITVAYATANGSATVGSDYLSSSGTLTIPAGQATGTITVLVKGDRAGEANETYFVNLTNPTNATLTDAQGLGTIVDDERRIIISDVSKSEGKKGSMTLFAFKVTLSAAYDQPVTMSFRTVNGAARTSNGDYAAKTGTLTFAPGETTKTITIEVKGDSAKEANETFYLDLFGNCSNSLFAKFRGIGTILNDD